MRFCLNLCSFASLIVVVTLVSILWKAVRSGKKFRETIEGEWTAFAEGFSKKRYLVLLLFVAAVGAVHLILDTFFCQPVIGAFYEKREYTQQYEAWIENSEVSMFCVVHITRSDGTYYIAGIDLPYGVHKDVFDREFSWEKDEFKTSFSLDTSPSFEYDVIVNVSKIADSFSYKKMDDQSFDSGFFVSSKNSNILHTETCRYVRRIKDDNKMYFRSVQEAFLMGHDEPCSVCEDKLEGQW